MNHTDIQGMFPRFNEITDEALRTNAIETVIEAIQVGGWDASSVYEIPLTLERSNTKVTLIEHINSVVEACMAGYDAVKEFKNRQGLRFDKNIVVAGALLHDVGKFLEYTVEDGSYVTSPKGKIMRHPLSGALLASKHGIPDEIVQLIAMHSHEGEHAKHTAESAFVRDMDLLVYDATVYGTKYN
ncbi:MAG: HD domain-containing protein [Lachnospiraceae bacterium]|nr:HD domain-containing protein [Lachnospiraceae bacterium]